MIYLVEDDNSIRDLVVYTLNSTGLEAKGFEKPSDFWEALNEKIPELILLDIMLPEEDGLQILKKLRGKPLTNQVPVIMLTAKGTEYDKVIGLDSGADDYITKPFGMMELVSRIKAMLRRTEKKTEMKEYIIDNLYVCPEKHRVKVDGEAIALTLKEFEMLCRLVENQDVVLTRDKLLNDVWGYSFDGESRTVDVHIRTLRQKLQSAGSLIQTIRGVGYKIGGNKVAK